jgi:hypothetical protein
MQKPKSIKELLQSGGAGLAHLESRIRARGRVLEHVCAALPAELAEGVVSAGLDAGKLTIGVTGGTWATRLRYVTETLRLRVADTLGADIQSVRIKVVPPRT